MAIMILRRSPIRSERMPSETLMVTADTDVTKTRTE